MAFAGHPVCAMLNVGPHAIDEAAASAIILIAASPVPFECGRTCSARLAGMIIFAPDHGAKVIITEINRKEQASNRASAQRIQPERPFRGSRLEDRAAFRAACRAAPGLSQPS